MNLRHIEITNDQGIRTLLVDTLQALELESLRSLSCSWSEVSAEHIPLIREAPHFPHIARLSFLLCDYHSATFAELLKKLTRLTHFSYIHYSNYEANDLFPCLIREGLICSKDSLQEISLINEDEEFEEFASGNEPLPFGSLLEFDKLRKLDATVFTLMGRAYLKPSDPAESNEVDVAMGLSASEKNVQFVDSLPQSLEELTLRNFESSYWSLVDVLLEMRRKDKLRKLSTVTLVPPEGAIIAEILRQEEPAKYVREGKKVGIAVALLSIFARQ